LDDDKFTQFIRKEIANDPKQTEKQSTQ